MTLIPRNISDRFGGLIPTNVRGAVSQRFATAQAASGLFAQLLTELGTEELLRRLNIVEQFSPNGDTPPPGLSTGTDIGIWNDGEGLIATVRPSKETRRRDPTQGVGTFFYPRNFVAMLQGDPNSASIRVGRTREATFFLFASPACAKGFNKQVEALGRVVPKRCHQAFKEQFLTPLSELVEPQGERANPFQRRWLLATVPLGNLSREVRGEWTAFFEQRGLERGPLGAAMLAAWYGHPIKEPLGGSSATVMRQVAPSDVRIENGRFIGSGKRFAYFHILPTDIKGLLSLSVDYRLYVKWLYSFVSGNDEMEAQMIARINDDPPGRAKILQERLQRFCNVVKPLTSDDDVIYATWAFQPGGSHPDHLGEFPVSDGTWLVNGLTKTISPPHVDGNIFVGVEPSGARYLIELGTGKEGGLQHFRWIGVGSSGKTTLKGMVALQIAGRRIFSIACNPDEDEAFPAIAYDLHPKAKEMEEKSLDDYRDEDGNLKPGIHFLLRHGDETSGAPGTREWGVYFANTFERDLETVFREDVVPAVKDFLEGLKLPDDFPISIRPIEGCNQALFAAVEEILLIGEDPWGETKTAGFDTRWARFAGPEDHGVVAVGDLYRLPLLRQADPNDTAGLFGHKALEAIFKLCSGAHKRGLHILADDQTYERFKAYPGLNDVFHRTIEVVGPKDSETGQHEVRVLNPRGEVLVTLNGTLEDPRLLKTLARRKSGK